ncbi:MAG: bifunctional tetrahydrofolate synthase/dihydrofolate synthase [Betaproteobacteria bacterium]|nr:bifunctional tetrahydrofolate synthase/dihydrofolate synthase [Betaproteobacteria bacterium]
MNPGTLEEWLDFIGRQHSAEIDMGLDRVRAVWQRMGSPQAPLNIVVGGTNGKGSTCAMLESIYRAAGYRTGFYSSPHFLRFNERVRIGGREVADAPLVAAFAAVERARQAGTRPEPLTYFEFATLAALHLFASEPLDIGILEVGLGGRLDAVNLVDGDVAIVVSVDLDHQSYLGDTREAIGFEKAHLFRAGRPAIFADLAPPRTVVEHAASLGAQWIALEQGYTYRVLESQWDFIAGAHARRALPLPALRGRYQLKNAASALMAVACLEARLPVSIGHIKRGLLEVEWPGRMQVLPGQPAVVLDVAHNPHAARALDQALGGMPFAQNSFAVFGMLRDKAIAGVISVLKDRFDHWFVAGLDGESARGATVKEVSAALAAQGLSSRVSGHLDIASAYAAARERAGPNDRIVAFGSFFTVAEILRLAPNRPHAAADDRSTGTDHR